MMTKPTNYFLYAVAGDNPSLIQPTDYGLDYAFDGSCQRAAAMQFGADQEDVILLARAGIDPAHLMFDPTNQTWRKAGNHWVGFWNDFVPTEESLRRPVRLRGDKITIRGQSWDVPKAIAFEEVNGQIFSFKQLDRYLDFDSDGKLMFGDIEDQFAPLYEIAMSWLGTSDAANAWSIEKAWMSAAQVMQYNYYASHVELCMIKFLTDKACSQILDIASDIQSYVDLEAAKRDGKKSEDAAVDLSTKDGSTEKIAITSQPVLTS